MGRVSNSKERLMVASTELTWQKGYNAVTVDAICERAGVKKGSFYYFFESKADLAIAAMAYTWETRSRPEMDAVFSASKPPLKRLKDYFEMIYQHQIEERDKSGGCLLGCPYFSLGMESSGLDPRVWHASQRYLKRKHRYLEATVWEAQAEGLIDVPSAEEAAQGIYSLLEGALARARVHNHPEPLQELY